MSKGSLATIAARHFQARQEASVNHGVQDERNRVEAVLPSMRVVDALLRVGVDLGLSPSGSYVTLRSVDGFLAIERSWPEGAFSPEFSLWSRGPQIAHDLGINADEFDQNLLAHVVELVPPSAEETFKAALEL